jgi:hypothetical protein
MMFNALNVPRRCIVEPMTYRAVHDSFEPSATKSAPALQIVVMTGIFAVQRVERLCGGFHGA